MQFDFVMRTQVSFGAGRRAMLAKWCQREKASRVIVVTDPGLKKAGVVDKLLAALPGIETVVYTGVVPNPDIPSLEGAVAMAREHGATAVIGLGGGSSMDVAKAVAALLGSGGGFLDWAAPKGPPPARVPVACVPTTAGTGSEVSTAAVITDPATTYKKVIAGPGVAPDLAILDPELMLGMPRNVVAETGMDALTHAIEAYVSTGANPFTDAQAIHAIRMIGADLARFFDDTRDLEAAGNMLQASAMAAIAFSHARLGAVHALSHPVSCYHGVGHGMANAILLPVVMDFNQGHATKRFQDIYLAMTGEPARTEAADAAAAVAHIRALNQRVGIPAGLRGVGVTGQHFDKMADDGMVSIPIKFNPRPCTKQDLLDLYARAM